MPTTVDQAARTAPLLSSEIPCRMLTADLRKADLVAVNRRYCRRDIDLLFHSPAREAAVHVLTRRVG